MPDPRDVSASKLLYKIVCEMADQPQYVVIKTRVAEDGATFAVDVHRDDTGKIIGKQGRNAKSLRICIRWNAVLGIDEWLWKKGHRYPDYDECVPSFSNM